MTEQKLTMGDQEIHEAAKKVIFSRLRAIRDISPMAVCEILDQNLDNDTMDDVLYVVGAIANELYYETQIINLDTHE